MEQTNEEQVIKRKREKKNRFQLKQFFLHKNILIFRDD